MANLINHAVSSVFNFFEYLKSTEDPRTKDWFMVSSPWPIVLILTSYLLFVNKIGPNIMAKRKPMKLDGIIQLYDVIQIIFNGYLFYKASSLAWLKDYSYTCQPLDRSDNPDTLEFNRVVYYYYILKVIDLLDTVFFVLRKKSNQLSFLHVYHHTGVVFAGYVSSKYVPNGHVTFLGFLNTFVHVVMYTHYLVSSMKIAKPWWKKYITQLQLVQFTLIFIHYSQLFFRDCDVPLWPVIIYMPQNIFMMVLFGDFYYRTYIKKSSKKRQTIEPNNQTNGKSKAQ